MVWSGNVNKPDPNTKIYKNVVWSGNVNKPDPKHKNVVWSGNVNKPDPKHKHYIFIRCAAASSRGTSSTACNKIQ